MATEAVESVETTPPWRRVGRGTVVPILLMLGLLFVLGQLHVDLAQGYTAPRLVVDAQGGYAFWDEGGREPTFCLRETRPPPQLMGPKRRSPGVLASAALSREHLVALLVGSDERSWFYSIYERKNLERIWTGTFSDPDLRLVHPRHLAGLDGEVFVFGTDKEGALRVARLGSTHQLVPVDASIPGAALPPPDPQGGGEKPAPAADGGSADGGLAAGPLQVPPPVSFASLIDDQGRLVLVWRVLRDPAQGRQSAGEVRWARFDGQAFTPLSAGPKDLAALALCRATGFGSEAERPLLLGLAPNDNQPRIEVWALTEGGFQLQPETIDYPREGFAGQAGLAALAAAQLQSGPEHAPRLVVLAQIGGAIRWRVRDPQGWGQWEDFARLPLEQRTVVYGWFGAVLTLCGTLVLQGLARLWRRRGPPRPRGVARDAQAPASRSPAKDGASAAGLLERALAFTTDGLLVLMLCGAVPPFRQALIEGAEGDPRLQLSLLVLLLVALLAWLTAWEALLRRTPGKWLLGLEVQDVDGGPPPASALLVRNLLRIELLLPPVWLAGMLTLMVMLVTPRHQRPGDLLARTVVVRRAALAPRPVEELPA